MSTVLTALAPRVERVRAFVGTFPSQKAAAEAIGASTSQLSKALGDDTSAGRLDSVEGMIALWKLSQQAGGVDVSAETPAGDLIRIPIAPNGHSAHPNGGRDSTDAPPGAVDTSRAFVARLTGGYVPPAASLVWSYVAGESMEPWLPDGSPILIEETGRIEDGGRYALWLDDGGGDVIKRIERIGGRRLLLISDNRSFPPRTLERIPDADDESEGELYRDLLHGHTLRLRVRGRIIYPRDTSPAVVGQLADFARSLIR